KSHGVGRYLVSCPRAPPVSNSSRGWRPHRWAAPWGEGGCPFVSGPVPPSPAKQGFVRGTGFACEAKVFAGRPFSIVVLPQGQIKAAKGPAQPEPGSPARCPCAIKLRGNKAVREDSMDLRPALKAAARYRSLFGQLLSIGAGQRRLLHRGQGSFLGPQVCQVRGAFPPGLDGAGKLVGSMRDRATPAASRTLASLSRSAACRAGMASLAFSPKYPSPMAALQRMSPSLSLTASMSAGTTFA